MNDDQIDQIVSTVLYEGYALYPYRPSVKNQQRWTFGGVYPRAWSDLHGAADASSIAIECLVEGGPETVVDVRVRCLHLLARQVGELFRPMEDLTRDAERPDYKPVASLEADGQLYHTWQEAVEREVRIDGLSLADLTVTPHLHAINFPAMSQWDRLYDQRQSVVGLIVRRQYRVDAAAEIAAEPVEKGLYRLSVRIDNLSQVDNVHMATRDDALMRSLVSTHTILHASGGSFVSLTDPPEPYRGAAAACRNCGAWPVLIGQPGERDVMLAAPIILYDYPEVAPESPGDLFDCTEIDEILTLRILTLTDDEKRSMAACDLQTRALLQRTSGLGEDRLRRLHGTVRSLRPVGQEE